MAGYNPASNFEPLPVHKLNWFQRWRQRRRDKKAGRERAWLKFLSGLIMIPKERNQFWAYLDSLTTDEILATPLAENQYLKFCEKVNGEAKV